MQFTQPCQIGIVHKKYPWGRGGREVLKFSRWFTPP